MRRWIFVHLKWYTLLSMLDFYHFVKDNPQFRQFKVDEFLFTAYDCPLEESPLTYWVDKNYFCFIIKGGAKWKTPKEEILFKVGDAVFLKKGAHRVLKIQEGEFCALLIFMPDEFISTVIKTDIDVKDKPLQNQAIESIIPISLDQSLLDYFHSVLNYFSQSTTPSKSLLKVKLRELVVNIATGKTNPALAECFSKIAYCTKIDLKAVMEENFTFNLNLTDFARLSGRSLATFHRDFAKTFQTSPGQWLKQKRLEYARHLLKTTDLSVNEITMEIGLENTSHFIKIFKECYNDSPLKYRKSAFA
ncbi:AraC family transcriptional regulator [Ekhidna sp.]|uniref:helix-turn-helix domain-containing protein n=1 Tax=Ekhidna sp. TaxID=2608089 RepID=UPI0032EE6355